MFGSRFKGMETHLSPVSAQCFGQPGDRIRRSGVLAVNVRHDVMYAEWLGAEWVSHLPMVRSLRRDVVSPSEVATRMTDPSRVRLDAFRPSAERGATRTAEVLWYLVKVVFFLTAIPWPSTLKTALLRRFGARVGQGVVIAPRVNIHMPWKLTVGDHSWIGEEVFLLSLEPISIGSNACISQRSFLCSGNHDYTSPTFDYMGAPITIEDGAWIGAQSFVGPGVTVGVDTVVTASSVVIGSLPDGQVCSGNPCVPVRARQIRSEQQ